MFLTKSAKISIVMGNEQLKNLYLLFSKVFATAHYPDCEILTPEIEVKSATATSALIGEKWFHQGGKGC